jgi:hypothetical protein
MKNDRCPRVEETRDAARRGVDNEDIDRHLDRCVECAEEALVSAFFAEVERDPAAQRPLPDPALIWRRATRARRIEAAERATRVITVWKWAAITCSIVAALAGAIRYSGSIGHLLGGFSLGLQATPAAPAGTDAGMAVMAIAGMLGVLVLLDRLVLAED